MIRTTDQMLSLVPGELREGSYALGSRRVAHHPHRRAAERRGRASSSGALLAVARAAGETAPLLFTIGIVNETNTNLFNGPNTALSVQIFSNATSPFTGRTGPGLGRGAHADRHRVRRSPSWPAW